MSRGRPAVAAALLAAGLAASVAGCASPDTAARLQAAVGPAFARLYAEQQHRLGHVLPARGPDGTAQCGRGGGTAGPGAAPATAPVPATATAPATATVGAGDDWTCAVDYPFPDGHVQPITYDVDLRATGCYTAQGPSAVVGGAVLTTPDGTTELNPLAAFDGCLTG